MKKLDLVQMENLQGAETFNQCMNRLTGDYRVSLSIAALTLLAGPFGLAALGGGAAALATFCYQHT